MDGLLSSRRPLHAGFNFTQHMERLCRDIVRRTAEFQHVDLARVGIGFRQTRKAALHGIYATLTPLRFVEGSLVTRKRGQTWTIQRLFDSAGQELLYVLEFYLPRFLDLPFREKLITVFHEIWHIGPHFDGDLRRHPGRCFAHGASRGAYDEHMDELVERWLAAQPDESCYDFLHRGFRALHAAHGGIVGRRWPRPRLVPA